jgi:hypothetical protein
VARIKTYVTVNGVDVTARVMRWEFMDTFGNEIPDAIIQFSKNVVLDVTIENGQEVIIKRGPTTGQEYNVFKGNVDTFLKKGAYYEIKAKDKLIALVKTDVNTSFDKDIDAELGVGSAIANTLITDSRYGGMSTNGGATVQSTGAVVLLEKFVCRKTDVFERVKAIADIYDYQIYYNYDDDYVYFEPTGYTSNANVLTVGSNVSNLPNWEFDNTQLVNQIRVEGAEALVETTELGQIGVTTGYTQTSITLTQSPHSVKLYVEAGVNPPTTIKKGGVIDATATFDYSVDEQNKKLIFNYTPGAADFVKVDYSYPAPIPVIRKSATSITAYGLSATTKHFPDVRTVEDAMNKGDLFLTTYAEPFVRTKLHVPGIANDYRAGQKVEIVDTINDENRELVINKIVKSFPHKYDIISVGNKEYAMAEYNRFTLDRIKRLEEELSKNDDILIQIFDQARTFTPKRRYMKLQKQSIAGDTLIWNNSTYGIWNSYKWGGTAQVSFILGNSSYGILGTSQLGSQASSAETVKLVQGRMIYLERCYDTDFHDAVNSTATFSTVTNDILFTAGQVWYSDVIDLGTTLSFVTVTLGTTVGTIKIEVSSDNKSTWKTLTAGVRTAVTSDGLGTYLRLTENAAGVASLDLTKDSFGQVTHPVVKMIMEE